MFCNWILSWWVSIPSLVLICLIGYIKVFVGRWQSWWWLWWWSNDHNSLTFSSKQTSKTRNFVSLKQMCCLTLYRDMHTKFGMIWTYSDKVMFQTRKSRRRCCRQHRQWWHCHPPLLTKVIPTCRLFRQHKNFSFTMQWLFVKNNCKARFKKQF